VFEGSFHLQGESYHIKPVDIYEATKRADDPTVTSPFLRSPAHVNSQMIVYRSSDYAPVDTDRSSSMPAMLVGTCGAQNLAGNDEWAIREADAFLSNWDLPTYEEVGHSPWPSLHRRSVGANLRRQTSDTTCKGNKRIVYFGVAADCTYSTQYQTPDKTRAQILSNWNQASAVYERQFNIMLGVIDIQLQDSGCPSTPDAKALWNQACSQDYPIDSRLSDFSQWRGAKGKDNAGLWHLMTMCASGSEVGIAWLGTLCQTTVNQQLSGTVVSYVTGAAVSAVSREEWQVVAHEIGHNFGAIHDCDDSTCPCNPGTGCSCCPCEDQCRAQTTLESAMCGNGIQEPGEECDCGTPDECANNKCCDGTTCKLKPGAVCSDSNALCCNNCQIRPVDFVCRSKYSECDVAETCDGMNSTCPSDVRIPDGTDCGAKDSGLQCASGQCTSRDAQCVARGGSLFIKEHCTLNTGLDPCDLQCDNPQNTLSCIYMSGSFIDGTVCGFHAKCRDGKCKGDNGLYDFLLMYQRNLQVAIPVTILIVIVVLAILYSICIRCYG
ncbi:Metallo-peptidase family M12-domain-containing protein, partial [Dimargaris cristalligena]